MPNARRYVSVAVTGSLALSLSGCGTILSGSRQQVKLASEPVNATVRVDPAGEKAEVLTPTTISLDKRNNYVLHFSAPGYSEQQVDVEKHLKAGYLIADVLLTALIGVVVDAVTGGWNGLRPKDVSVTLKKTSAAIDGPDEIRVSVTRDAGNHRNVRVESSKPGVHVRVATR